MSSHVVSNRPQPGTPTRIDAVDERSSSQADMRRWAEVSGAGTVADLKGWFGLWCRDADEVCDRVRRMDAELRDLQSEEVSTASLRAWICVSELHSMLTDLRHQANLETDPRFIRPGAR